MARCGDRDNHEHADGDRDNHEHADVVFPLGGSEGVLGGWGFFPSPQVGVWTRCLLIQILSMNPEQKRMVLVASGVRDRRQKIEWVWVGVGDLNEDGVAGGIEYGFMSFTTRTREPSSETISATRTA